MQLPLTGPTLNDVPPLAAETPDYPVELDTLEVEGLLACLV